MPEFILKNFQGLGWPSFKSRTYRSPGEAGYAATVSALAEEAIGQARLKPLDDTCWIKLEIIGQVPLDALGVSKTIMDALTGVILKNSDWIIRHIQAEWKESVERSGIWILIGRKIPGAPGGKKVLRFFVPGVPVEKHIPYRWDKSTQIGWSADMLKALEMAASLMPAEIVKGDARVAITVTSYRKLPDLDSVAGFIIQAARRRGIIGRDCKVTSLTITVVDGVEGAEEEALVSIQPAGTETDMSQ